MTRARVLGTTTNTTTGDQPTEKITHTPAAHSTGGSAEAALDGAVHDAGGGTNAIAMKIITTELECFRIVMDIRDELTMISSVISDQSEATKELVSLLSAFHVPSGEPLDLEVAGSVFENTVGRWNKKISNIQKRAKMVERAVCGPIPVKPQPWVHSNESY
jgi:hypothetical protein